MFSNILDSLLFSPYQVTCLLQYSAAAAQKQSPGGALQKKLKVKGSLSGLRPCLIFGNWKPCKNDEKCFLFHLKSSFRSQDIFVLKFLSWYFGHVTKPLDMKDKVDFKFYDVTAWLTNNCNTHIS